MNNKKKKLLDYLTKEYNKLGLKLTYSDVTKTRRYFVYYDFVGCYGNAKGFPTVSKDNDFGADRLTDLETYLKRNRKELEEDFKRKSKFIKFDANSLTWRKLDGE